MFTGQLSTLERVRENLDVPMWEVIRDAERAEYRIETSDT
jgi:hypothetical protein